MLKRIDENAHTRLNAHAEDITELACRLETLVVEQAGNDRTFRELISDNAELALRVDKLEGELVEAALELARHIRRLSERIEKLEKRVEPGFHFADMACVERVDEDCIPDLQGPGQYVELKED